MSRKSDEVHGFSDDDGSDYGGIVDFPGYEDNIFFNRHRYRIYRSIGPARVQDFKHVRASSLSMEQIYRKICSCLCVQLPSESFHVLSVFNNSQTANDEQLARQALCNLMLTNKSMSPIACACLWARLVPISAEHTLALVKVFENLPPHRASDLMPQVYRLFLSLCPSMRLDDCAHRRLAAACVNLTHLSLQFCAPLASDAFEWTFIIPRMKSLHTIALDFFGVEQDPENWSGERGTAIIASCLKIKLLYSLRLNRLFDYKRYRRKLRRHRPLQVLALIQLPECDIQDTLRMLQDLSNRTLLEIAFVDCSFELAEDMKMFCNAQFLSLHSVQPYHPNYPPLSFSWLSNVRLLGQQGGHSTHIVLAYMKDAHDIRTFPPEIQSLVLVEPEIKAILEVLQLIRKTFPARPKRLPTITIQDFYVTRHTNRTFADIIADIEDHAYATRNNILDQRILFNQPGFTRTMRRRASMQFRKQKEAFEAGLEVLRKQYDDEMDDW